MVGWLLGSQHPDFPSCIYYLDSGMTGSHVDCTWHYRLAPRKSLASLASPFAPGLDALRPDPLPVAVHPPPGIPTTSRTWGHWEARGSGMPIYHRPRIALFLVSDGRISLICLCFSQTVSHSFVSVMLCFC